ncbi:hypothetical protein SAY87_002055 [Trapa incisa]|uniref:Acyl-ACP-thioesterase N-terminal domain-containing protein n=1 Tax=Trapa incisa TaxID=236973 RepID=A0AAN7JTF8_9MYRT|nr:hypothetical protein SAY87_002055 [Trapa incisa]
MVTTSATSAFFPVPSPDSSHPPEKPGNGSTSLSFLNPKPAANSRVQIKANAHAHAPPKINGWSVGFKPSSTKSLDYAPVPPARTFINQLPDWSMLLAAITTVFLAGRETVDDARLETQEA